MPKPERQQNVLDLLKRLRGIEPLKQLFWSELNYQRVNQPLSRRGWTESAGKSLADDPVLFAGGGEDNAFHIIYCRLASDALARGFERPVVTQLLREHPYALFVFSNQNQTDWHFLNVKYDDQVERRRLFRRITVRPGAGLRTATERVQLLDLAEINPELFGISPLAIQQRCDAAFDVETVTKDFFREIANWYFWALKNVRFPKDALKEADGHDHISIIRLITRLIFCWFVKEKGLIPDTLFDERKLTQTLTGFAPAETTEKESVFYKAILQNLFFATLNTEMDKRAWRKDDNNFMAHILYRHRALFQKPNEALDLFKNIPFLNGGLFECLDKREGTKESPKDIRIDGFSDRGDSQPIVPDFLFFSGEREVNLSAEYDDAKFSRVPVRGLIHIFNRYNFTVEENTPIEQEVALDPELSGKVFENLLAAYNPETGATARKQTGSFYTPREIVNYMVDEALIACLQSKLVAADVSRLKLSNLAQLFECSAEDNDPAHAGCYHTVAADMSRLTSSESKTGGQKGKLEPTDVGCYEAKLRHLFAYNDEPHQFTAPEVDALIAAIDGLKSLDPAVGSGAFPMGILHKLVFILGKLDPRNEKWKERQIARVRDTMATAEKIEDATARERAVRELEQQIASINEAFEHNEMDYGRKLYLIENCIYGVDIQPIAVQIAKMRFFISLIVDQKIDDTQPNRGVRPLPNLETKFVAANTLIGIERPDAQGKLFSNAKVDKLKSELSGIRHRMFTARTPSTKQTLREKDKEVRLALSGEIQKSLVKANEDEIRQTRLEIEKARNALKEEQSKPVEWEITRFTNLFGETEETRIDTAREKKRHLREQVKRLESSLLRATQRDTDIDATARKLASWNPYDQNASADFFDPEWMFGIADGFNVCLGNPPYVLLQAGNRDNAQIEYFRRHYKVASYKLDLYHLFIEQGVNLLKEAGTISFITPSNFASNNYAVALRQFLLTSTGLDKLVFFDDGVFDASVHNLVFVARKTKPLDTHTRFCKATISDFGLDVEEKSKSKQESLVDDMCLLVLRTGNTAESIIQKMAKAAETFGSVASVNFGMQLRDRSEYPQDVVESPASRSSLTKFHRECYAGKDVHRFYVTFTDRYCYFNRTAKRGGCWDEDMHNAKAKILVRQIGDYPEGGLDGRGFAVLNAAFMILPKTKAFDSKFLLGVLNSAAIRFYWLNKFRDDRKTFPKIKGEYLKLLPVPKIDLGKQTGLVQRVDQVVAAKKMNPAADTSTLEREIDQQVYALYGLTPEEIKIVEDSAKK